jgi:thiamine biosynthesis lipoprotein
MSDNLTSAVGRPSRRNVLTILGAAVALPAGVLALRTGAGAPTPVQWRGESLGGPAYLTLWHRDPAVANRTIASMRAEIERLETIFSLHRQDSEIVRLNARGRLNGPSRDLVFVLEEARRIAQASAGAFDPTVQPLWKLWASRDRIDGASRPPAPAALEAARALVDFSAMEVSVGSVRFARDGMAITLNGIAQGYITDRIADLLRNEGFDHAMVELGETRAIGAAPDGRPFRVGIVRPDNPAMLDRTVQLADEALSVSGGYGFRFGPDAHHIFDPSSGRSPTALRDVVVKARRAVEADALSTAIYVAGEQAAPGILRAYRSATAILTRADGSIVTL